MIEQQINSSNEEYLITPSLLNSWGYIWECEKYVREAQSDEISLEDKIALAKENATKEFINTLLRIKSEPNESMLKGIEFEEECYKGNTCISPIIKDGCFQIVGMKRVKVNDINFLMYGKLDVLKGGVVYDIKRVRQYACQKYFSSYQHGFYLDLFERAYKFQYLAFDDKEKLHIENYYRDEYEPTINVISRFMNWLNENGLMNIYKEYWKSKGD